MEIKGVKRITKSVCAAIVAHPDDETLWMGGTILMNPGSVWTIVSLCRRSDTDRNPKFFRAMEVYKAVGIIADLDDGPEQTALPLGQVKETIVSLLPQREYDFIFTHSPDGEYTRHRRHEETASAVLDLIEEGELRTKHLRLFAYEDGGGSYTPRAISGAEETLNLPEPIRKIKYEIITGIYGFNPESWEARTVSATEAFWNILPGPDMKEKFESKKRSL